MSADENKAIVSRFFDGFFQQLGLITSTQEVLALSAKQK